MNENSTGNPRRSGPPLLKVRGLEVRFGARRRSGAVEAVRGISFTVEAGETLGLIGESGSGKTTVARAVVGLVRPSAGSVSLEGTQITGLPERESRRVRRRMHLIFQDPYDALHPGMRISEIVEEPMRIQGVRDRIRRHEAVLAALEEVGLTPASRFAGRYPHELSGGQRQRVAIARALVLEPALVLADEPTSMLDVSLRAEILQILKRHRDKRGAGYLFITHDLALARHFCDRIAVMFRGRIVELGPAETVVTDPRHPYTRTLLRAAEELSPRPTIEAARAANRYHPDHARYNGAEESWAEDDGELREIAPDHYVARQIVRQPASRNPTTDKEEQSAT
ncbi:MAG: ATP-binding cassette domain-containing protein [Actinomycetota bacterium]|nr:ATP-binding cassette domain-containing protein [Actinomycetota bacterium]